MFLNRDVWQEIFDTMSKNKLRTFLTGFSVMWGILMLIILLGSGKGLQNGIFYQFRDDAINSIWISPGMTRMPYKGMQPGRFIQFTNEDYDLIDNVIPGVEHITSRFFIRSPVTISYKKEYGSYTIRSVHPGHAQLEKTIITEGRFINNKDLTDFRKVTVLGHLVEKDLFGQKKAMGKYIKLNNIPFKVVGIFKDEGGEGEERQIYLPITTAQKIFNGSNRVGQVMFTTGEASYEQTDRMAEMATQLLSNRHTFDPNDKRAVFVRNNNEEYQKVINVFNGIELFIWFIGIGTLLAGVVGISNIMMIVVKERTREIGVRKALGATPGSIISLILQESVFVTGLFGYIGMVVGIAVLEIVSSLVPPGDMFMNPEVDLRIAVLATVLLVVSGTLAGLIPAIRAATIRPITALRDE